MSERRCEGCRWFRFDMVWQGRPHGVCRRSPPVNGDFSETSADNVCGEWADKNITAEEAERRDLIRQFALAIVQGWYASDNNIGPDFPKHAWNRARTIVEAENEK